MADEGHPSIRMSSSSKLCVTADGSKMDLKYFKAEVLGLFSLALQLLQLLLLLLVSLGSIGFIQLSTISRPLVALLCLSYCLMKFYSCRTHSHDFWLCAWPFLAPHGGCISIWSKLTRGLYIILMCHQGAVGYLNGGVQKRDAEYYWYYFTTFTMRIKRNLQSRAK